MGRLRYDIYKGVSKAKTKLTIAFATVGLMLGGGGLSLAIFGTAHAATNVIYNNIPSPLPGNVVSQAFEAQSASEFGGQVSFAGTDRQNPTVTVLMSSWGCETGHWYSGDCSTTPGHTFSHPITLNVYNVGAADAPGSLVTTKTQIFNIPYRPSVDNTNCTNPGTDSNGTDSDIGKWYNATDNTCYNGLATPIVFNFNGVTLPNKAIVSVAYNTTHYGYSPIGESATCFGNAGGCGYDSLNVGLNGNPSVGTDPLPNDAYINSSWSGAYCSGAAGTFRLDTVCWTGYQPAFKVETNSSTGKALGLATGGLKLSGVNQGLDFEAHDYGPATGDRGNVNYNNFDAGLHYNAQLTCVDVTTNTVKFAYQIPPGNFVSGVWVVWKVVDGGSPGKGNDQAGFVVASDEANATSLCESGAFAPANYTVVSGNAVVHKN